MEITWEIIWEWMNKPLLQIGNTPLTIGGLVTGIFVFLGFIIFSVFFRRTVFTLLSKKFNIDPRVSYSLQRVIHYVLLAVGLVFGIQTAGFNLTSLTVILGFLSVGVGFGLQSITSNFFSGIIMLIERPISVGDVITLEQPSNELVGTVVQIGMRSTLVKTFDNVNIIVPNSQLIENQVVNWSYGDLKVRLHIAVGVAYGSDTENVTNTLLRVAKENDQILADPGPGVWFTDFGDSSLNFELLVWVGQPEIRFSVASKLRYAIDKAFREEKITIPYPQRDIHIQMTKAIQELSSSK